MEENSKTYPTTEFGEKYLPIGTVVILKEAQKRLIIIGYDVRNNVNESRDYCGCFFPEGLKDANSLMVFDHEKIDKVYHMGLYDEESESFFVNLKKLVDERDSNPIPHESPNSNIAENNMKNPYNIGPNAANNATNPLPEINAAPNIQQNIPFAGPATQTPVNNQNNLEEPVIDESELKEPVIDESELEEPTLIDDEPTNPNPTQPNNYNSNMQ